MVRLRLAACALALAWGIAQAREARAHEVPSDKPSLGEFEAILKAAHRGY